MTQNNGIGLSDEMHGALVKASCDLLKRIQRNLQPCELPGRSHYCFSLKDLIKVFQVSQKTVTHIDTLLVHSLVWI